MFAHTLLLVGLSQTPAAAPARVDITEVRKNLDVVTDGKKHYLVYDRTAPFGGLVFYGDGVNFGQVKVRGGGRVGDESFNVSFWEPRVVLGITGYATFSMSDTGKKFDVQCAKKLTPFTRLADADASKLIGVATFSETSFTRRPEQLLRDDKGNYYFVDRLRTADEGDRRDFRLFIGPRGKMKVQPLKDIVDDSEGMIFSTKDGQLRLVTDKTGADLQAKKMLKWVAGKAETPLIDVPLEDPRNLKMLYVELGPYDGVRLGTPCDDLF